MYVYPFMIWEDVCGAYCALCCTISITVSQLAHVLNEDDVHLHMYKYFLYRHTQTHT